MPGHKSLFVLTALVAVAVNGYIEVPLTRNKLTEPITKSQKMLHDYHAARRAEGLQSLAAEGSIDATDEGYRIALNNTANMAYTGPAWFGTPAQYGEKMYIYDTGSGIVTTTTTNCYKGCDSHVYDPDLSTTKSHFNSTQVELRYGSANLTGNFIEDRVCLANGENGSMCADNFTFFEIVQAEGLTGINGLVGFSPVQDVIAKVSLM